MHLQKENDNGGEGKRSCICQVISKFRIMKDIYIQMDELFHIVWTRNFGVLSHEQVSQNCIFSNDEKEVNFNHLRI